MDDTNSAARSRRAFLAATAATAAGALAGCTGGTGGGSGNATVSVLATADYQNEAFLSTVEESIDASVDLTAAESAEAVRSATESDSGHDVLVAPHQVAAGVVADGGAQAIATDELSNYGALYEPYRGLVSEQLGGDDGVYGVPTRVDWTGYAYDSSLLPDHEPGWSNVFGGVPGSYPQDDVALLDDPVQAVAAAAFNLGYGDAFAGESISLTESQLGEVRSALKRHKRKYLYDYISGQDPFVSGMNDDEFLIGQTARSNYVALRRTGNNAAVMQTPPEGALTTYDAALVAEGASDTEAALSVVDAFVSAQAGATLAAETGVLSANGAVDDQLSESDVSLVGSVGEETLSAVVPRKPVENRSAWTETLQAVKDS